MTSPLPLFRRVVITLACAAGLLGSALAAERIPVVLHTDIGTDIDDTWALAQVLRTPELDLRLILVDTSDTLYRAKVAAKVLERAGRTDIPIALGVSTPMPESEKNQLPWVKDYDLNAYPGTILKDGVSALLAVIGKSERPVTLISVGPVPGLAEAVRRDATWTKRTRFVGMHGSFDIGYGGGAPSAESNVKLAPAALQTVLAATWADVLLTPLDTCGSVDLEGDNYRRIWCATEDPLLRAVIEGYCIFAPRTAWMNCDFFATKSTTLFDCVAVYLATAEDLVEVESLRCRVTDDGFTVRDPNGSPVRVALRWKDRDAWENGLTRTLLQKR